MILIQILTFVICQNLDQGVGLEASRDINSRISDTFDPFIECELVYDCIRRIYFEPIVI